MSGQLQRIDDDAPARCSHCGALAVGPCARCRALVCGDCCVLTEHGTKPYAICLRCDARGGRSLRSGWALVLAWVAVPIVILAAAVAVLAALR